MSTFEELSSRFSPWSHSPNDDELIVALGRLDDPRVVELFGESFRRSYVHGKAIASVYAERTDDESLEELIGVLQENRYYFVRSAAAEALGKRGGERALAALRKALEEESHPTAVEGITEAIKQIEGSDGNTWTEDTGSATKSVQFRESSVERTDIGDKKTVKQLLECLEGDDRSDHLDAIRRLKEIDAKRDDRLVVDPLLDVFGYEGREYIVSSIGDVLIENRNITEADKERIAKKLSNIITEAFPERKEMITKLVDLCLTMEIVPEMVWEDIEWVSQAAEEKEIREEAASGLQRMRERFGRIDNDVYEQEEVPSEELQDFPEHEEADTAEVQEVLTVPEEPKSVEPYAEPESWESPEPELQPPADYFEIDDAQEKIQELKKTNVQSRWGRNKVLNALDHPQPEVRKVAVEMLVGVDRGKTEVELSLVPVLEDEDITVRAAAVDSLARIGDADVIVPLMQRLGERGDDCLDKEEVGYAVSAIMNRSKDSVAFLKGKIRDGEKALKRNKCNNKEAKAVIARLRDQLASREKIDVDNKRVKETLRAINGIKKNKNRRKGKRRAY